jgi:hypothetical protein
MPVWLIERPQQSEDGTRGRLGNRGPIGHRGVGVLRGDQPAPSPRQQITSLRQDDPGQCKRLRNRYQLLNRMCYWVEGVSTTERIRHRGAPAESDIIGKRVEQADPCSNLQLVSVNQNNVHHLLPPSTEADEDWFPTYANRSR